MTQAPDVGDLFQQAQDDDLITADALRSLRMIDLNAQIQPALGIDVSRLAATEMVLVTLLMDDSRSIKVAGNAQRIRDGHNRIISEVLQQAKGSEDVTAHCRYLNRSIRTPNGMTDILYNYVLLPQAVQMTADNYDPEGITPLYDQLAVVLATAQAEAMQYINLNMPCRSIVCVVTDGADYGSHDQSPATVRPIVQSMLAQEFNIIAAMGIQDDVGTDFREVFRSCGVPEEWILTPDNTDSEIRRAFGLLSRSISRASQTASGMTSNQVRAAFEWD